MMVMPYLNGPEYSVDCLAEDGVLVKAVTRVKFPGGIEELLDDCPDLIAQSAKLTELLGLTGLYNVQFLEARRRHAFLAGNQCPHGRRHSLGHLHRCPASVLGNFARLPEQQLPTTFPEPKTGIRFNRKTRKVVS